MSVKDCVSTKHVAVKRPRGSGDDDLMAVLECCHLADGSGAVLVDSDAFKAAPKRVLLAVEEQLRRRASGISEQIIAGDWEGVGEIFNIALGAVQQVATFVLDAKAVESDQDHPVRVLANKISFTACGASEVWGLYQNVINAAYTPPTAIPKATVAQIEVAVRAAKSKLGPALTSDSGSALLEGFNDALKVSNAAPFAAWECAESERELVAAVAKSLDEPEADAVRIRAHVRRVLEALTARNGCIIGTLTMAEHWFTEIEEPGRMSNTVVVRGVYDDLYSRLQEVLNADWSKPEDHRSMLVLENAGIGKSWALNYLLYALLRDGGGQRVVVLAGPRGDAWVFLPGQRVLRFGVLPSDYRLAALGRLSDPYNKYSSATRPVLLLDVVTKIDEQRSFGGMCVVAASENDPKNYSRFEKDLSLLIFHMPYWGWFEFEAYCKRVFPNKSADEIKQEFEAHGGVLQFAFAVIV